MAGTARRRQDRAYTSFVDWRTNFYRFKRTRRTDRRTTIMVGLGPDYCLVDLGGMSDQDATFLDPNALPSVLGEILMFARLRSDNPAVDRLARMARQTAQRLTTASIFVHLSPEQPASVELGDQRGKHPIDLTRL